MTRTELTDRYWAAVQECLEEFHAMTPRNALTRVQEARARIANTAGPGQPDPHEKRDGDVVDDPKELPAFEDLIYHAEPWNVAADISGSRRQPTRGEESRYRALLEKHRLAPLPPE
jgi:hypothetical protein